MLGWVITCHDDKAEELLSLLKTRPAAAMPGGEFWRGMSANMLSRMMCDALHATDSGDGVIF